MSDKKEYTYEEALAAIQNNNQTPLDIQDVSKILPMFEENKNASEYNQLQDIAKKLLQSFKTEDIAKLNLEEAKSIAAVAQNITSAEDKEKPEYKELVENIEKRIYELETGNAAALAVNEGETKVDSVNTPEQQPENTAEPSPEPEIKEDEQIAEAAPSYGKPMSLAEAVEKANGNLEELSFEEIAQMHEAFANAGTALGTKEQEALNKLETFARSVVEGAAGENANIDMRNAPELSSWLLFDKEKDSPSNKGLRKKLNAFYQQYDKDHKLEEVSPLSSSAMSSNYDALENIQGSFDPFKEEELNKVSDFYDTLKITNLPEGDQIDNESFKAEMLDLAARQAQTELMQNKNFANMSPEEKTKAYKESLKRHLEQGICHLVSSNMGAKFQAENADLINKIQDPNTPEAERQKLAEEYKQKSQALEKATEDEINKYSSYFAGDKNAQKPEVPEITNCMALGVLYEGSQNCAMENKRIAQKSGFMKMWDKVKKVDHALTEKHPKTWTIAKNLATSAAISVTLGPVGMGLWSAYKTYKTIQEAGQKAEEAQQGFFDYLKTHKVEAAKIAIALGGSVLTMGLAGADVLTHGIGSAGGMVGQIAEHSARNGGDVLAGVSEWASNLHANTTSASGALSKVYEGGMSGLWDGIKHNLASPKTFLRTGLSLASAGVAYAANLSKGRKEAKKAALGVLAGTGIGLIVGGAVSEMSEHGVPEDNKPVVPPTVEHEPTEQQVPETQTPEPQAPEHHDQNQTPSKGGTPKEEIIPKVVKEEHVPPAEVPNENILNVNDPQVVAADKVVYEELLKRNAYIVRNDLGIEDKETFLKELKIQTNKDMEYYQQLVNHGKIEDAEQFMKGIHDRAERYEGQEGRVVDEDDSRSLRRAKIKAQESYNEYIARRKILAMLDKDNPNYANAQAELDQARMEYAKNMVKVTDKECRDLLKDLKKDPSQQELYEQTKAARYILKHGDKVDEALLDEAVDKLVPGMSIYNKSDLNEAVMKSIAARNGLTVDGTQNNVVTQGVPNGSKLVSAENLEKTPNGSTHSGPPKNAKEISAEALGKASVQLKQRGESR